MRYSKDKFQACCGVMKHCLVTGTFVTDYETVKLAWDNKHSPGQAFKCCPYCWEGIVWEKVEEVMMKDEND